MKRYCYILILSLGIMACSEERHEPTGNGAIPGMLTNYVVENYPGVVEISFQVPDEHTAYVMAEYQPVDGMTKQVMASKYSGRLRLEGFANEGEYEVLLYAVGEGEQRSEPTKAYVSPLTPPYLAAYHSLQVGPAFGGFVANYTNDEHTDLTLEVVTKDEKGQWSVIERNVSNLDNVKFTARGYDDVEQTFGFYIRDRWANFSDTLYATITPYDEQLIDMSNFYETNFPTDQYIGHAVGGSRKIGFLFDGSFTQQTSWYTQLTSGVPQHFTIFLQDTYQLSRIKLWQRGGDAYYYQAANPRFFEIYGSMDPDPDGTWDSWTLLGSFENIKPSGDPDGANTPVDNETAEAGEDYEFEVDIPPVRYIRFRTTETWGLQSFVYIAEMEIYGAKVTN